MDGSELMMTKDSQVDNKLSRELKSNWDHRITSEEEKNKNRTAKKQSIERSGQ